MLLDLLEFGLESQAWENQLFYHPQTSGLYFALSVFEQSQLLLFREPRGQQWQPMIQILAVLAQVKNKVVGLLEAMLIDRRTLSQLARTHATARLDKTASISMKSA